MNDTTMANDTVISEIDIAASPGAGVPGVDRSAAAAGVVGRR